MTKKLILVAAVAAGLLVLAVVVALFTDFDSPELGRLALGQIGKASGFDLEAQGFRLNLLRGLELEGVEARATDGGMTASMDRLVLKHRPADLLGGTLTVTEIMLDRPRVELESIDQAPASASGDGATSDTGDGAADGEATSLDLAISTIRLEDGYLVQRIQSGGEIETTEIRGLEVEIHDLKLGSEHADGEPEAAGSGEIRIAEVELSSGEETTIVRDVELEIDQLTLDRGLRLEGTTLTGDARLAEVVSGTTEAKDVSGRVELDAGRFQLRELDLTTPQGVLRGDFAADLAAEPLTYSLDLHGDALSTGVLLGLGDLGGIGTSTFKLQATGTGSDTQRIAGGGNLTISSGELPDHPALVQVEQILGNVALVGAGYEAFPLDFDLSRNRVHLAPCELRAGGVSLTLSGWVDFDGPLEMELSVLTPREGLKIKEIPAEVLEVLAEADGRINLPMLMTGTADGSSVKLNQKYLAELGKRYARKRVENELGKALRGLLGDD